jgi:hypothetical protein
MDKKQKYVKGNVLLPLRMGEGVSIVSNDKVTFTSVVMAVHGISANTAVIETMNTIYTVVSPDSDICISLSPIKARKKRFFGFFG